MTVADLALSVQAVANPEGKSRQWLTARIRHLAGTRLAGFVLVHDMICHSGRAMLLGAASPSLRVCW